ncbi:MAG: hypothetical protein L3J71_11300 [Victivallaceae bacterium]|nr:hypothetical protein [Victivallaceae bacterium]
MIFSSHLFIFYFLPLALLFYYLLPRRGKHLSLTVTSYIFYGWANPLFMCLMLYSTVIDYICGLIVADQQVSSWKQPIKVLKKGGQRSRKQKIALFVSIATNLSLLGFFKYFNFAIDNYNAVTVALGLESMQLDTLFRIILPLGISFYTFQSMSYTIDIYKGNAKAIRNFIDFACYVSMFPQLVAGPIIRFQEVANQLESRIHSFEKFARGLTFLFLGMGKKILLANPCGKIADLAFNAGGGLDVLDSWYGATAYAFQIYFDFSGYSDMAIGLGLMLGFVFPKNFDSPYISKSITEFWRRWHLSLSFWLRDYLYISLGGSRKGNARTYINLAAVMLLGGLWHGSSWNFLIWGAIHGGLLAFERMMGKDSIYRKLPGALQVLITFILVLFSWVFFRADTLTDAWLYCQNMLGIGATNSGAMLINGIIFNPYHLISFCLAGIIIWAMPQTWDFTRKITWPRLIYICAVFVISLVALTTQSFNPFIYFIF